ncbi:hypothetical protein M427DRAFT_53321 [Gonapodya prolifera JEL478]|uniref:Uncharacterized protein n=1 Tax=Gonapodya prolifera (strain JEL478) TaxID=1344416 RepID=A0A139AQQ2_GONPJ|nr:hypothetical protein M427DRAFT_53321 [Gonapodya prolifera JEL478]|eukprot:KXS18833.1 hypothetical protein M427DRAFT_53321 [Gonapodya prolifera JEL478]
MSSNPGTDNPFQLRLKPPKAPQPPKPSFRVPSPASSPSAAVLVVITVGVFAMWIGFPKPKESSVYTGGSVPAVDDAGNPKLGGQAKPRRVLGS